MDHGRPDAEGRCINDMPGHDDQEFRSRLAAAWHQGHVPRFLQLMEEHGRRRVIGLLMKQRGLTDEEAEDCYQESLARLLDGPRRPGSIADPFAYVKQASVNVAIDVYRRSEKEDAYLREAHQTHGMVTGSEDGCVSEGAPVLRAARVPPTPLEILEGLDEGVSASSDQARRLLCAAADHLPAGERAVLDHVLRTDPHMDGQVAAAELGIGHNSYRTRKHRMYSRLRRLLPNLATEIGIETSLVPPPEGVIAERHDFPTPEGDG